MKLDQKSTSITHKLLKQLIKFTVQWETNKDKTQRISIILDCKVWEEVNDRMKTSFQLMKNRILLDSSYSSHS